MSVKWADAGLARPAQVRDCWRFTELEKVGDGCEIEVPPRFVEVLRLYPAQAETRSITK